MAQLGAAPVAARVPRFPHTVRCAWFWAWVPVGALGALGFVSLGVLAIGPAVLIGALFARSATARRSASGLLTGAGLPLLLVAYVQRDGPGTTCYRTATTAGCDQHLNPLPWLLLGLALVAAGYVGELRRSA